MIMIPVGTVRISTCAISADITGKMDEIKTKENHEKFEKDHKDRVTAAEWEVVFDIAHDGGGR